jgi:hypothetical protein
MSAARVNPFCRQLSFFKLPTIRCSRITDNSLGKGHCIGNNWPKASRIERLDVVIGHAVVSKLWYVAYSNNRAEQSWLRPLFPVP